MTARNWPADPASAWAEAVRSPASSERLADPPDADAADAASIADWIEDQRSVLPLLAIVSAVVGVLLIGGLLIGSLPRPEERAGGAAALWAAGTGLLVASVVLGLWEAIRRRRRRTRPARLIPEARLVVCELHPTRFAVREGDGYRETCVAIAADTPDAQAARLADDDGLARRARDEAWNPRDATVFASEEIFGPDASGGYLVRRPNPPADGWGVLITPRRPARIVGQLRFAEVRRWTGTGWSR
ncbi:hypothetical protein [Microbacterium sp. gxy059]|uniref:hypothetical protein n=1 Tax=Microbacterium sp. gxy059 TaxID=2957199 RepID=UPI003D987CD8